MSNNLVLYRLFTLHELTLCILGNFSCFCCRLLTLIFFFGKSNSLDPDQDRYSVCPDLSFKLFAKINYQQATKVVANKETVSF